jgi:hypothetical protein
MYGRKPHSSANSNKNNPFPSPCPSRYPASHQLEKTVSQQLDMNQVRSLESGGDRKQIEWINDAIKDQDDELEQELGIRVRTFADV